MTMIRKLLELFSMKKKSEPKPVQKVYRQAPKGKVVAKILLGYDIEYMYKRVDDDPGVCPVCHTALKKSRTLNIRYRRKKAMCFTLTTRSLLSQRNSKDSAKLTSMRILNSLHYPNLRGIISLKQGIYSK